jgi:hypothetical protein
MPDFDIFGDAFFDVSIFVQIHTLIKVHQEL